VPVSCQRETVDMDTSTGGLQLEAGIVAPTRQSLPLVKLDSKKKRCENCGRGTRYVFSNYGFLSHRFCSRCMTYEQKHIADLLRKRIRILYEF